MNKIKKCIECGKEFEDFGPDNLQSNVCPDCFNKSCREIDEYYDNKRKENVK